MKNFRVLTRTALECVDMSALSVVATCRHDPKLRHVLHLTRKFWFCRLVSREALWTAVRPRTAFGLAAQVARAKRSRLPRPVSPARKRSGDAAQSKEAAPQKQS